MLTDYLDLRTTQDLFEPSDLQRLIERNVCPACTTNGRSCILHSGKSFQIAPSNLSHAVKARFRELQKQKTSVINHESLQRKAETAEVDQLVENAKFYLFLLSFLSLLISLLLIVHII